MSKPLLRGVYEVSSGELQMSEPTKGLHSQLPTSQRTIWAIGGGKGGVGKSLVSSSLAICLARMRYDVTLVDLDLGGANLHTCLGLQPPPLSITDFLTGRTTHLSDLLVPTLLPKLSFIGGFNNSLNIADLSDRNKDHLIHSLYEVPSRYVILDLGAGTHESTLDFFLMGDKKIVTVVPEPTSIENAYRFIKAAYYRWFRFCEQDLNIRPIIEEAMDHRNALGIRTPADLIRHLGRLDPSIEARLANTLSRFHLDLVINQVRTRQDSDLGPSIRSVCKKYFGIEAHCAGSLDHDNAAWQALRKKKPLLLEYPHSNLVGQFLNLTKYLMEPQEIRAVI